MKPSQLFLYVYLGLSNAVYHAARAAFLVQLSHQQVADAAMPFTLLLLLLLPPLNS
jgi:hypothetical protein